MIEAIKKIFSMEDLKSKICFTFLLLAACRVGAFIPVPGINAEKAVNVFKYATGGGQNLFQLMDVFSGGAFAKMTIIALGVMPYITASIILQIVVAVLPSLQREMRENGDLFKKKLSKWTRLATMFLALFHSAIYAKYAVSINISHPGILLPEFTHFHVFGIPILFYITMMFTMTAGSLLLMWIGEQITEKGIGNGVSMVITVGILSSLPSTIGSMIKQLNLESQDGGQLTFTSLALLVLAFVVIIIGTILIIQGQRKVPLEYARRSIGEGGQPSTSYIPLKINYAGVIPVIFASSVLMFPATIVQFIGQGSWLAKIAMLLTPGNWIYTTVYVLLILFFTFFWTSTQFHPDQIASEMKKSGAFIPGIRQGKPTQEFLDSTMGKITLIGGLSLAFIAILPTIISKLLGVDPRISHFFGGTSLLILVGVILDTAKQLESHLVMKRYDGFMKKSRLRIR